MNSVRQRRVSDLIDIQSCWVKYQRTRASASLPRMAPTITASATAQLSLAAARQSCQSEGTVGLGKRTARLLILHGLMRQSLGPHHIPLRDCQGQRYRTLCLSQGNPRSYRCWPHCKLHRRIAVLGLQARKLNSRGVQIPFMVNSSI